MSIHRAIRHALAAACTLALSGAPARADGLLVFAAASLMTALDTVTAQWTVETGWPVAVSYAGTPALARQIEEGAPADVFVSADRDWMDHLEAEGLIDPETRRNLLGNRIVLVASDPDAEVTLAPGVDIAGLLGPDGRLAVADVAAVPAGRYAKAALESLGAWDAVASWLAEAENVRAALALVARGEAPFGVVYATDAVAEPAVTVAGTFPSGSHPPIVYPAARVADSADPGAAAAFLAYLASPEAQGIFAAHGFEAP